jgi:acetyl-CoA carboxylase biotin carboxyl carrier protein
MEGSETSLVEVFDVDRIRRLVELMKEHDLSEIDLRQGDQRIRLSRGGGGSAATIAPPAVTAASPPPAVNDTPTTAPAVEPAPASDGENVVTIKSPMVGTFYAKANPNAEPYVRVGDSVTPETTVCVIEAMKVFNEIPAEVGGRVLAVLVEDEESVEFGKPLFKIDTSG